MTTESTPRERDPFLEAVGRVALASAELDISLKGLLGRIAPEPTLLMYANSQNTKQLIDFCKLALRVEHLAKEDIAEISACLDRAESCRARRNDIIHGVYAPTEADDGIEAMNPMSRKLGYRVSSISVERMETLADEITVLMHDMFSTGWNATAGKLPGALLIPPRAPGQTVNGITPKK